LPKSLGKSVAYIDDFKRFFVGWTSEDGCPDLDSRAGLERHRLCLLFNIKGGIYARTKMKVEM
jgi:hypothetical protein